MSTNLGRDDARHRSRHLDLLAYEVELDLSECVDPDRGTYPSRSTIRLRSTTAETFLDFVGESVEAVEVNGGAREVEFDGARVQVRGLDVDAENVVTVRGHARYSRSGEGLHRYVDPADGRMYLYTQCEPSDSRRVFAQCDQPDLKSRLTFVVTGPDDWEVLSNSAEVSRAATGENSAGLACSRRTFAPTPPLSTYITCVAAGPYARFSDEWSGRVGDESLTVPLGMFCRASLVDAFDPEELFAITKQGLDFFHEAFAYPYPWGKYDSIFVPEYNLGAMENPGLVTFSDAGYVFQSGATRSQHESRSSVVLHEMAHMWFGDLVTPRWWDDLWLKESFADYMGSLANAEATEFTDAWTPFCARRKAWAYLQDQLPTTHPIVADIPDVEAAKQNFDGITYAKGASVLKQLVAYVGQEAFLAGSRAYFRRHEFASTELADLLAELEGGSGRDLGAWSRAWLETSGVNTLIPVLECEGDTVTRLTIRQDGEPARPHRLVVGLYGMEDGRPVRTRRIELDVTGAETVVEEAAGLPRPALVVVNDDDLTYAKVRLDDLSLGTVRRHLGGIESSLTRACVWSALWNACRDAVLPAAEFLEVVLDQAPREEHVALLDNALVNAGVAVGRYLPADERDEARRRLVETCGRQLRAAEPGSGAQLTWARALARTTATCGAGVADVRALLDGSTPARGLEPGPELRWQLWEALAASGHVTTAELDGEREHDHTSLAPVRHLRALSSIPSEETKARVWDAILDDLTASNDETQARIDGFARPGHDELLAPYVERYFDVLDEVWRSRSQELAQRIVRGLFPGDVDADALEPGQDVREHPVVAAAARWLDAHPDAAGALRRIVVESRDHALRALRAQRAAGTDEVGAG